MEGGEDVDLAVYHDVHNGMFTRGKEKHLFEGFLTFLNLKKKPVKLSLCVYVWYHAG